MKKQIEGWAVAVTWRYEDGTWNTETITEFPNEVAQVIDDHLTELESEEE